MAAHMYILECSDGSFYVGSTRNLDERIAQHLSGRGSAYTSRRMPVKLVYSAEFEHIGEAYAAEKRVQGWSRAKRLALINNDFGALRRLSVKGGDRSR
ncbi:Excinuclease ABC C subunit domain protein [Gordonia bronchialis DSM 43247]|uniref:Excinuclease ABC C subunit domain protein n=1 Tax=Gordonia bronchialis (strain ATCC 25592 / DSM 43247 / BCRC 13721 / JCM 3198 / KCTC 3076 / NBRC 16047 / NCTC 10667) TaxID=526226 RepID=D0L563_GORB4|nr:GIY-YIG nuclease family protein [Gordonia bronchialis]ACY23321.1 Excinuclease ABC C subunit domain protein [Gordonia bronchialis DSM 43247]MCC3321487.1 GIY-YIG nuclease family protein [Gordonia bronchialis]QGS23294.1 GIY-YIG nuclease family protein [Gordonia bronchialis]UAK36342.1 GIY-YIG nuclease family protein [Gordonia bronchialis]STQ66297.1 GIY-YIG nuclease superfamily protein [Gordonia bronchialis]